MKTVHIVDYGTGNIGSLASLIQSLGMFATVTRTSAEIITAQLVILPGVGAAGAALANLRAYGILNALHERFNNGSPTIGICLGAQLFGSYLHEAGEYGFGWMKGDVMPLPHYPFYNNGWCRLDYDALRSAGLGRALNRNSTFYFNHKYAMGSDPRNMIIVDRRPDIPAIYLDDAICAIQFHPEKSQNTGRLLLRNVIKDHYGL